MHAVASLGRLGYRDHHALANRAGSRADGAGHLGVIWNRELHPHAAGHMRIMRRGRSAKGDKTGAEFQ